MTSEQKQALFAQAELSLDHILVEQIRDEYVQNMRGTADLSSGLPRYGLWKVMVYTAIVARAQALDIDPHALAMNEEEGRQHDRAMIQAATEAGVPVTAIVTQEG